MGSEELWGQSKNPLDDIALHAWVMMTNHTHLLLTQSFEQLAKSKQARLRAYSQLFDNPTTNRLDTEIRWGVTRNLAAGSEKFKAEIEALTGVAQALRPRGPKKDLG